MSIKRTSSKQISAVLFLLFLCFFCLLQPGCASKQAYNQTYEQMNEQAVLSPVVITIVTTLFPQYDFARAVAGDKANVVLLLPPGVESHEYEPAPADIKRLREADVFVYTSDQMEPWARSLARSSGSRSVVVDASTHIMGGMAGEFVDPHIWTNPLYAKTMVDNIAAGLCEADPMNTDFYRERADEYKFQLDQLDEELRQIVDAGSRRTLVLGGRNAFVNLAGHYGLTIYAAYDSCAEETEPHPQNIARIIEMVKAENLPVIYYEELVDARVARTIGETTGKPLLMLHSCHNVSRDELADASFLSLMRQNAANIAKGLE